MSFKKKNIFVLFMLIGITISGIIFTQINTINQETDTTKIKVVTSFYPMYVATANIISEVDNIELSNLTQPQTGCLHDYQLTPHDMITLETADVFIINGGGMESFIEDIVAEYPNITIINAGEGIELLETEEHNHDEQDHNHEENNAHLWVSITKYMQQIENITNGLAKFNNLNEKIYSENADIYITKLKLLKENMHSQLKNIKNRDIIIFHDSFAYFAQEFELNVKHTVIMESDTSLSAGVIAQIINEINEYNIKVLFTEEQYSKQIANAVAKETNANVYILDSGVSGDMDKNSYINAMEKNLEVMKDALN